LGSDGPILDEHFAFAVGVCKAFVAALNLEGMVDDIS